MKNVIFKLLLSLSLISLLTGCVLFRDPLKDYDKIESRLSSIENKVTINSNSIVKEAGKYVYASQLSLEANPETNKYTVLSKELNYKALNLMGPPDIEDMNTLKKTVDELLSSNASITKKGEYDLAKMDAKVIELQKINNELQGKLDTTQKKATEIFGKNSSLAQKWAHLTTYIWLAIYAFVGMFILRIVSAACPPPYNSVANVIAIPFTWVIHLFKMLIPEAIYAAGWVESEYKVATGDLVNAIQKIKSSNPTLHSDISSIVGSNTSDVAIAVINKAKADNGIVS